MAAPMTGHRHSPDTFYCLPYTGDWVQCLPFTISYKDNFIHLFYLPGT